MRIRLPSQLLRVYSRFICIHDLTFRCASSDVAKLDAEISAMRMDIDGIVMDYAVKDNLKKKV